MSLIEETKKEIGYVESPGTCRVCKYCEEIEHPHVSRMWVNVCTVSNLCTFLVEKTGTCTKYERGQP